MELDIAYLRVTRTFYCAGNDQHQPPTLCSLSASCCFVPSPVKEGRAMLPPGDHERACRVFCRILRRLEERDRRNGKNIHSSLREGTGAADNHRIFGAETTNRS